MFRVSVAALLMLVSGCATFPRRLDYVKVPSPALLGTYAEYAVFLPPEFSEDERLPLVVFLHGGGDGPDSLDRHGISERLEVGMRNGDIPRALIVLPQGDLSFWANFYDGSRRYEDWVVDEVMSRVARRYRTADCPAGCHLMGVSMGGEGSLRIALHRPNTFASVTTISAPIMDTARRIEFMQDRLFLIAVPLHRIFGPIEPRSRIERDDPFLRWTRPADLGGMRLFVAWTERDRDAIIRGSTAFHEHLLRHEIEHEHRVFEGGHNWASWAPIIEEALRVQLSSRL